MEDRISISELRTQSNWSGKRVVLFYWMGILFLGTGVAIGLGTQFISPKYTSPSTTNHITVPEPWHPDTCQTCHPTEYNDWLGTGMGSGTTSNGSHVFMGESTVKTIAEFNASCAHCMATRYDNSSGSVVYWDFSVTCAVCHDPGVVNHSAYVCGACHYGPAGPRLEDYVNSGHYQSLNDMLATGEAEDSCLHCMSGQGTYWPGNYEALGVEYNLWLNNTDLTTIACATCHDPMDPSNATQLRNNKVLDLCGRCHNAPDAVTTVLMFTDVNNPHNAFNCTNCHGYDLEWIENDLGGFDTGMNHTWLLDLPHTCDQSGCHDSGTVDERIAWKNEVQGNITDLLTDFDTLLETVKVKANEANKTEDTNQEKVDSAFALIEEAETLANFVKYDSSTGFHNPDLAEFKLYTAISKLTQANTLAQEAIDKAEEDEGLIPGFELVGFLLAIKLLGITVLYLRRKQV